VAELMAKPLEIFMDEASRKPFEYGVHDCGLNLADWVLNVRGVDPAAHLRGRYSGRWGYLRICVLHGGYPMLVESLARHVGLTPTTEPKRGDIGLLMAFVEPSAALRPGRAAPRALVGAICAGRRWLSLSPNGMIAASGLAPSMAWKV
jgi:hypothetical protein